MATKPWEDEQWLWSIPETVTEFFRVLLRGETQKRHDTQSSHVQRLINSFAQDYVFTVSIRRFKPAKHILLLAISKSLTGNGELTKFLNKLGHGASYSQLEKADGAQCLPKIKMWEEKWIAIPSNILHEIPTNVVWDNIDRNEESLSQKGSSRRINGIFVQCLSKAQNHDVLNMPAKPHNVLTIEKSKKHSIKLCWNQTVLKKT